jgi:6-pyruvoyltetrahydropterin/6-carboxytetrahydropterin synthase
MSVVYLTRRATFSASHRLHSAALSDSENARVFGKCNGANGHGHNYTLEATVRGEVHPDRGMVMNITELRDAIDATVMKEMDHKHLNLDVPAFRDLNPTAENIAVVCWRMLEKKLAPGLLHEVKLWETENNIVVYRGE